MGSRDRPGKEIKKKAKVKDPKSTLQPLLAPPTTVEVIKPMRKPRRVEEPEEG